MRVRTTLERRRRSGGRRGERAPEPMGDAFARRFAALSPERRSQLISALATIADMMAPGDDLPKNTLQH